MDSPRMKLIFSTWRWLDLLYPRIMQCFPFIFLFLVYILKFEKKKLSLKINFCYCCCELQFHIILFPFLFFQMSKLVEFVCEILGFIIFFGDFFRDLSGFWINIFFLLNKELTNESLVNEDSSFSLRVEEIDQETNFEEEVEWKPFLFVCWRFMILVINWCHKKGERGKERIIHQKRIQSMKYSRTLKNE